MNLSKEQTIKLIELAGYECAYSDLSSNDITKALITIEEKLNSLYESNKLDSSNAKVLIVDDLELSTYQLTALLKKIKVAPTVVHSKSEAISELKKQKFDFVFVDLFLPDQDDGIAVMRHAHEYRLNNDKYYKIVAISGTDDLNLVTDCFNAGVDEFVSKGAKWHEQILRIIVDKNEPVTRKNFIRYDIDDATVTYNIKSLSKAEYVDELYNNAVSVILVGVKNLILNLENIKTFPQTYAKLFTELYKKCSEVGGHFIILAPSEPVREVLDFSCLTEVISVVNSSEEAFAILNS